MSKAMSQATGSHNLRVAMMIAAVLLVLTLVAAVQTTSTTGGRDATPAISSDGNGSSSLSDDPYIERHAEIVARHSR
jgi:hypothetical protein